MGCQSDGVMGRSVTSGKCDRAETRSERKGSGSGGWRVDLKQSDKVTGCGVTE